MDIALNTPKEAYLSLQLNDDHSPDWQKAIEILRLRIELRYFEPVDMLIQSDDERDLMERRYGFTILAIDCLLVETFQAFKEGMTDTKNNSTGLFKRFLTTSPSFKAFFPNNTDAEDFYQNYRCGILHIAEVGSDNLVRSVGDLKGQTSKNENFINRTEFHKALKADFYSYLKDLANVSNQKLRANFRKKMDFIARK